MVAVAKFNNKTRQELRDKGGKSLFFFAHFCLGMKDLAEQPHLELCENLDGRGTWGPNWTRGLVTASRGFLKSSIATIAYPIREGLYRWNWSCRILGSSEDNVKVNFFDPITNLFREGPNRNLLIWLYGDPSDPDWYRIPERFDGWTDKQLVFRRTDPLAKPAITYKGMGSDQEGWHGDLVIGDDLEGGDYGKSNVDADAAYRAVYSIAPPLLISPETGKILVVGTPHGGNPLVYRILEDRHGRIEWDNSKRDWKFWFKPLVDAEGKSNWPERFPDRTIEALKRTEDPKTYEQQRLLKKISGTSLLFNMDAIRDAFYKFKDRTRKVLQYPVRMLDVEKFEKTGVYKEEIEWREVHVAELRFFLHVDFVHRKDTVGDYHKGNRPSRPAIVATGVSPDNHIFVMGYWSPDEGTSDLDDQALNVYRYYRDFAPYQVTFDPIGAQVWFRDYAAKLEKFEPSLRKIHSTGKFGRPRRLPTLSSKLVEDKRPYRESKDAVIADRLDPWIRSSTLHFRADGMDDLLHQLRGFPEDTKYVDIVDALAQGPPIWTAPMGSEQSQSHIARDRYSRRVIEKHTGYWPAYARHGGNDAFHAKPRFHDAPPGVLPGDTRVN